MDKKSRMDQALEMKFKAFKRRFPTLLNSDTVKDEDVFPAFYLYVAYFKDAFSERLANEAVCGETGDGGIDAIFPNPAGGSEVVIVQSKCTKTVTPKSLDAELSKISSTLREFTSRTSVRRAERVKAAFARAVDDCEDCDNVCYAIDFVTCYIPESDRRRKTLIDVCDRWQDKMKRQGVNRVTMIFGDRLLDMAETWNCEKEFVDKGELRWFPGHKFLRYRNSYMLNLRASSLKKVYTEHNNKVLGLNLRYHVMRNALQKEVDTKIEETICKRPDDFWYLNNGVMIVCRKMKFKKGDVLELCDYSIVNGGQTTYNIYTKLRKRDFAVPCKIVVVRDRKMKSGKDFAQEIAVSANSQKPIAAASLVANEDRQKRLEDALADYQIGYLRKEGARPAFKKYRSNETVEDIGKLGLAGILLMPMEARNKTQTMFESPYYKLIFRKEHAVMFRDLIVLRKAYTAFRKNVTNYKIKPSWCHDREEWRHVVPIALTFVLSSIVFCIRMLKHSLNWNVLRTCKDADKYALVSGRLQGMSALLRCDIAEGKVDFDFDPLFQLLVHVIYDACKDFAIDSNDEEVDPTAFLKSRTAFAKFIAPRLRGKLFGKSKRNRLARLIQQLYR